MFETNYKDFLAGIAFLSTPLLLKNYAYFWEHRVITGFVIVLVLFVLLISLTIAYFIEYKLIKNHDIDRIKDYLLKFLSTSNTYNPERKLVLISEEKHVTSIKLLTRCFNDYLAKVKVYIADGEFLCTVYVSKSDVVLMEMKQLVTFDLHKELDFSY
ncbi:hypothetical protein [Bacillus sp. NPDC094106]|uniref:hypothetical protein n=1 Tax=Bacillus sp. NPDC094106 TaxID=3363949 RepID=UPI0038054B94